MLCRRRRRLRKKQSQRHHGWIGGAPKNRGAFFLLAARYAAGAFEDAADVRRAIRNSISARGFGFEDFSWLSASARAIRPLIKSGLGMRWALRTAASAVSGLMPSVRAA